MNCLAGTVYEDFISKILKNPSEKKISFILKSIVLIAGIVCIGVVYIVDKFEGVMQLSFIIAGITNGPTLAIFTIGMLFPFVNSNVTFSNHENVNSLKETDFQGRFLWNHIQHFVFWNYCSW